MEQKEFTYLLQQPSAINRAQTSALSEVLEDFPFFQAARALQLKGLKNQNSFHYNKALKVTAAHTLDREVLFDFITSEEFNQNEIAEQIKHQEKKEKNALFGSEVVEEDNFRLNEALKKKIREEEKMPKPEEVVNKTSEEEKLHLGAPLTFKKEENHSFSEWLKLTTPKPIEREENLKPGGKRSRKFKLIDEFISKSPKINPVRTGKKQNLAEESLVSPEALMTETLARVYLEQKNYKKAIQAYKILILKNPEKSGFFADQIRAIEKIQEQNSQ